MSTDVPVYFSAAPPAESHDAAEGILGREDPRLSRLFMAASEPARAAETERVLALLAPVIDQVIARDCRAGRVSREDADDLRAGVVVRVLRKLRAACADRQEGIEQIEDYVATLTRNSVRDFLRARYPERARMKNRIRFLLGSDDRFAAWSTGGATLCGLAGWRGTAAAAQTSFPCERAPRAAFDSRRPAEALLGVFRTAAGPLELDALVTLMMELWSVPEVRVVEMQSAPLVDGQPTQLARLETRELLLAAWGEIAALPPLQRTALLLNLRDHEGNNALTLFVLLGVGGIDEIARLAGMPAGRLAELWPRLPLDDVTIAARLGVTRQQVINLRKSARERLRRRLRTHLMQ